MFNLKILVFLFICITLLSCREATRLEGFDSEKWKSDRYACKGIRSEMQPAVDSIRRQFYGLEEKDVSDILGKADSEQLMARGQRQFLYYLEPGSQCEQTGRRLSEANRLEIRFNSLNKVSEVSYFRPLNRP